MMSGRLETYFVPESGDDLDTFTRNLHRHHFNHSRLPSLLLLLVPDSVYALHKLGFYSIRFTVTDCTTPTFINHTLAVKPFNKLLHPWLPAFPVLSQNNMNVHCLCAIIYCYIWQTVSHYFYVICWPGSRVVRGVTGSFMLSACISSLVSDMTLCWVNRAECNYPLSRHTHMLIHFPAGLQTHSY